MGPVPYCLLFHVHPCLPLVCYDDIVLLLYSGLALSGVSFLCLGPSVLVPFVPHNIHVVGASMMGIGIGGSAALMPMLPELVQITKRHRLHKAHEVVSGLANSAMCLGEMISPVLGMPVCSLDTESPNATNPC